MLYQIGNNAHHDFCYETALEHPGVVVVHEANLHHLIADITIKRGDWDAYMHAIGQEGGAGGAGICASVCGRSRSAPDYEGVPMLRRLLARSKGAIVHSGCVESELRSAGFRDRWRESRMARGFRMPAAWTIATGWDWTRPRR